MLSAVYQEMLYYFLIGIQGVGGSQPTVFRVRTRGSYGSLLANRTLILMLVGSAALLTFAIWYKVRSTRSDEQPAEPPPKVRPDAEFRPKKKSRRWIQFGTGSLESADASSSDEAPVSDMPVFAPLPKVHVTDETSREIFNMMTSVNSIVVPETGESPPPTTDHQGLEESGLIEAFARTQVSEPIIEETSEGKFGRMSIDADLFLDGNDEEPNEK